MFESLFILSGTYLLLNAASYVGEILHAHAHGLQWKYKGPGTVETKGSLCLGSGTLVWLLPPPPLGIETVIVPNTE